MQINDYDYVAPKEVNGKILITSFPGLDENGIFQGQPYENSDTLMISKTKEDYYDYHEAKISVTDELTNRVTITLPENFYNK